MNMGAGKRSDQVAGPPAGPSILGHKDIGFTDLFNRYQYLLIGIDTYQIGIIGINIGII